MPKGTKVSRCVDKVKKSRDEAAAIAICQASTNQGYATGRKLKESIASKVLKPGPGKPAKKLKDNKDDSWEKEEKREGYITPRSDDKGGYDSPTDDNASDDFKNGRWTNEDPPKKYKKKLKESLYKQIGSVLAEKLGFSQTQMDAQKNALKPLNPKPKRAKTPSLTAGGNKTTGANAAGDEGVPVGNDANKKSQELQQQGDKDHAMYEKEDTIMNKERIDEFLPAIAAGLARTGAMVGRGVAKAGAAVTKTAGKAAGKAAGQAGKYLTKKAGEHAKGMVKTGVKNTLAKTKEKLSPKDETMEDNTQYKNKYVRKLMEMDGPTETNEGRSSIKLRQAATQQQSKEEAPKLTAQQIANRAAYARGEHPKKPTEAKKPTEEHTAYQRIGVLIAEALGVLMGESSPNARPMTPEERKAMHRLASAGRGGDDDKTPTRTRPGARKVIPLEKPKGESTIYHRMGRLFIEAIGKQDERNTETGSGSDFKPGEGPKAPKDMTAAEKKDADTKTAKEMAKRAASNK